MNSDWKKVALEEITQLKVSNVDKKIYPDKKLVKLCNYMDVYRNRYITSKIPYSIGSANTSEINAFGLEKGDIIITKDSETPEDIGVASVVTESIENLVCGYHLAILKPNSIEISSEFLMHLLHLPKVQQQFYRVASGSTRYGLTKGVIESLKLEIPKEKPQQTKIAQILTTIDNVIEKTEAAIAKYEAIKQGMMHDLFTRGIGADGQLRPSYADAPELYKESGLGWIPKEWEVSSIYEFSELKSGGTPSRKVSEYWGGTINWVKTGEINYSRIERTEERITNKGVENSAATIFPKGTLLMAIYGEGKTRGRVAILGVPAATNQACLGFMIDEEKVDLDFLYYSLWAEYQNLREISNEGSQKNLSKDLVGNFVIKYPKLIEQKEISKKIKSIDNKIKKEFLILSKQTQLKQGLMQDLLTGKVPVKI